MAETTNPAPAAAPAAPAAAESVPAAPAPAETTAAATPAAPAAEDTTKVGPATGDQKPVESTTSGTGAQPNGAGNKDGNRPASPFGDSSMIFILIGVMVLMFFWMSRSQKKREQQRLDMLKRLKVGEKVMTGSGIIAEIVEMDDDEVTLRIDPRKDVRMRVKRSVILGPAGESASDQALKEQQPR